MRSLAVLICLSGCASTAAQKDASLEERVRAMRAEQVQDGRRIDELENKLMLMEDRLETRRVAEESEGRIPVLPVVRVAPAPPSTDASQSDDGFGDDGFGDDGEGPRPLLKLHGNPPQRRPVGRRSPRVEIPEVTERIPVVPLPRAKDTRPKEDPLAWYRKHHGLLRDARYEEAQIGFERFLKDWPDHDYADNAAYWIGECHYAREDWPRALTAFRHVLDRYPKGNKAPGALLKLGYTYLHTGERDAAIEVLNQVVQTYARADVAKLAQAKLEEIHD